MKLSIIILLFVLDLCQGFLFSNEPGIQYHLFQRSSVHQIMKSEDNLKSSASKFNPAQMTYFIIHGWNGGDYDEGWKEAMIKALLNKENANVFYVSWKSYAHTWNYLEAKSKTKDVGKDLASLIMGLEKSFNANRQRMHLIGHSLGGQVAGFAGANLQVPSKLARITALDISGFGYRCNSDKNDCLDPSDADFVDEINTLISVIVYGGHAEFYPIPTDSFKVMIETKIIGAHSLGGHYFVKSIEAGPCAFQAVQCDNLLSFKAGRCDNNEKNSLGFYAKKPSKYPTPQSYFMYIDINKPC